MPMSPGQIERFGCQLRGLTAGNSHTKYKRCTCNVEKENNFPKLCQWSTSRSQAQQI